MIFFLGFSQFVSFSLKMFFDDCYATGIIYFLLFFVCISLRNEACPIYECTELILRYAIIFLYSACPARNCLTVLYACLTSTNLLRKNLMPVQSSSFSFLETHSVFNGNNFWKWSSVVEDRQRIGGFKTSSKSGWWNAIIIVFTVILDS